MSQRTSDDTNSLIQLTMHELLEERVAEHPDRQMHVFVSDNERITFREFHKKVVDLAAGFLHIGLGRGDCVSVIGNNHMEWPLIVGAARAIGVATVGLQIGHPLETLSATIQKTSSKALFITRSPDSLYADACRLVPGLQSSNPGNLNSNKFPNLKLVVATGANSQSGTLCLDDLYLTGCEDKVKEAASDVINDDISFMCMTSGSTGLPKLVHYTHLRALNTVECLVDVQQVPKFACLANIAYTGGTGISLMYPLVMGSTVVYPSPKYSFEKFIQSVHHESVTHFVMPVESLAELAYSPVTDQYDLSSLRGGLASGSPIPLSILSHLRKKFKIDMMNSYGLTEIYDVTCLLVEDDDLKTRATVGRPLRNVQVQIVDSSGNPVGVGSDGEVWVRHQVPFQGYYKDVEKTRDVITSDGWFKTGDVGKLSADGYLTLVGRIKDIIIRDGINIHPFQLETLLMDHPAVKSVQVLGIPDSRVGEDVCVCVITRNGHTLTEKDMKLYYKDKCIEKRIPTYCLVFESFPLGITGKVGYDDDILLFHMPCITRIQTRSPSTDTTLQGHDAHNIITNEKQSRPIIYMTGLDLKASEGLATKLQLHTDDDGGSDDDIDDSEDDDDDYD